MSKQKPKSILRSERRSYADSWDASSEDHERQGHYAWMAGFVADRPFVLEVGCGAGRSTLELATRGHVVVSVEENPDCISRTVRRLMAAGIPVESVLRGSAKNHGKSRYRMEYSAVEAARPEAGVLIVEGQIGFDAPLAAWLESVSPFDAVLCWLVGANRYFMANVVFDSERWQPYLGQGAGQRLAVQNRLYEMAGGLVGPGGILHITDRGERVDSHNRLREGFLDGHAAQAEFSALDVDVDSIATTHWELPEEGVDMIVDFNPERGFGPQPLGLNSIISRRH